MSAVRERPVGPSRVAGSSRAPDPSRAAGGGRTRTVVVVPQKPELLIVQVGSNANWDYQSQSPTVGRAAAKVFDISKAPDGGYMYNTQGWQLGYGMRNEVGIAIDPAGHAWGVENSGDVCQIFQGQMSEPQAGF